MELSEAKSLAIQLMTKHCLPILGWRFEFDQAKKRFGQCRYGRNLITLSGPLTKLNPESQVRDTILHEIAHALVGSGHGHDSVWKAKCREIGCLPERCCSNAVLPSSKYEATCPRCLTVHKRFKRAVKRSSCNCTGRFNPDTVLIWKQLK